MKINTIDDSLSISWEPVQAEVQVDFTGADGEQTVFGWFKNEFCTAQVFTDDIILNRECAIDTFYWESSAGDTLTAGDLIHFYLSAADDAIGAETGGDAAIKLGGSFQDLHLTDNNDGTYSLDYYIQSNDFSDGGYFQAQLINRAGNLAPPFTASEPVTIMTFWEKSYDHDGAEDHGRCVEVVSGGGYIVAGQTAGAAESASFAKTDGNGAIEWDSVIDYGGCDAHCVRQTFDGGFIITGETDAGSGGLSDVLLVKIDASGNERWHQFFGGNLNDIGYSVLQAADGGFVLTGEKLSGGDTDIFLLRTNAQGDLIWEEEYGGSDDDSGKGVIQTVDGGYIIGGNTGTDLCLIETDANGTEMNTDYFGGSGTEAAECIRLALDGGLIAAGWTGSFGGGDSDIYLIKILP